MLGVRELAQLTILGLGALMTLAGLASLFVGHPYPEIATAGITAILGTGLVSTIGKDKE